MNLGKRRKEVISSLFIYWTQDKKQSQSMKGQSMKGHHHAVGQPWVSRSHSAVLLYHIGFILGSSYHIALPYWDNSSSYHEGKMMESFLRAKFQYGSSLRNNTCLDRNNSYFCSLLYAYLSFPYFSFIGFLRQGLAM